MDWAKGHVALTAWANALEPLCDLVKPSHATPTPFGAGTMSQTGSGASVAVAA